MKKLEVILQQPVDRIYIEVEDTDFQKTIHRTAMEMLLANNLVKIKECELECNFRWHRMFDDDSISWRSSCGAGAYRVYLSSYTKKFSIYYEGVAVSLDCNGCHQEYDSWYEVTGFIRRHKKSLEQHEAGKK